jgi:hypothetical protein
VSIIHGDALHLPLANESIDAVVCDPPYSYGFMSRTWDTHSSPAAFAEWCETWAREAYRVLKPGGHLLAFGGARTSHRLACGIEDAGFEMRDAITWLYGQGFPKSLDVGKAIDKARHKREDVLRATAWIAARVTAGCLDEAAETNGMGGHWTTQGAQAAVPTAEAWERIAPLVGEVPEWLTALIKPARAPGEAWASREVMGQRDVPIGHAFAGSTYGGDSSCKNVTITAPAADAAKQWAGWGTALKPSFEPVIVARKPLAERTVAGNVQTWGTGAINVDGCRVGNDIRVNQPGSTNPRVAMGDGWRTDAQPTTAAGRWPTNVVLTHTSDCVEVGTRKVKTGTAVRRNHRDDYAASSYRATPIVGVDDTFAGANGLETIPAYDCAAGCPVAELDAQSGTLTSGDIRPYARSFRQGAAFGEFPAQATATRPGDTGGASRFFPTFRYQAKADSAERVRDGTTAHCTVKPLELMRWLVRLVTPPDGLVLDMFAGSGTTAEAALLEGFRCIAIERDASYLPLIRHRLNRRLDPVTYLRDTHATEDTLFGDLA